MTLYAVYLVATLMDAFQLIEPKPSATGSIFGFAEYLASLALFLVIMTSSDFRYRYRLSLTKTNLRKVGFWVALGIGTALLLIDWWYQNGFPTFKFLANPSNLKAALALILLGSVSYLISVAVIRPPTFTKANAQQFLSANYHFIHEGNPERLQVIAEELQHSLEPLFRLYTGFPTPSRKNEEQEPPHEQRYAHDFFLLLGDHRFCSVVVSKVPTFAIACFEEAQKHPHQQLPISPFVRNVGQEFIRNKNSAFYHEISGYDSGLIGYTRPITNIIYGHYDFIETYSRNAHSPLEMNYRDEFDGEQFEAYARASLTFLKSYLQKTGGRARSQAFFAVHRSFEHANMGVHKLDDVEEYHLEPSYARLKATVDFLKEAIELLDKHAERPRNLRVSEIAQRDIHDLVAELVFETIFAASMVSGPGWTNWAVQHNAVFSKIFGLGGGTEYKIIGHKVRRLIYDEIMEMNKYPNFKGARLLGYCLNVLGIKSMNRQKSHKSEFYPLQVLAVKWAKENYKRLLEDSPKVALACLHGTITYDKTNHRLIKTYAGDTQKEAPQDFLDLD